MVKIPESSVIRIKIRLVKFDLTSQVTRSQSSNFWKTDSRLRTKGRDLRRKGIGCEVIGFGFDNETRDETVKSLLLKNIR